MRLKKEDLTPSELERYNAEYEDQTRRAEETYTEILAEAENDILNQISYDRERAEKIRLNKEFRTKHQDFLAKIDPRFTEQALALLVEKQYAFDDFGVWVIPTKDSTVLVEGTYAEAIIYASTIVQYLRNIVKTTGEVKKLC